MRKFTPLVFLIAAMLLLSNFLPSMAVFETSPISSYGAIQYPPFPLLQGWGGVRLQEVTRYSEPLTGNLRTEPPSEVFPGEVASDAEMTMRLLKERGYNAIRALFEDPRDYINGRDLTIPWELYWVWNAEWFEKFVEIARHYDLWMICDYHEYDEPYLYEEEWISLWQTIISTYKDLYEKLVWEPCNEPLIPNDALTEEEKVEELGRLYQRWIDMCRDLGDTHYIIVSGKCFWSSLPKEDWYPQVEDSLNRTYLNFHFYYFKEYHENQWTIPDAQNYADYWTGVALSVQQKYQKPFLTTESGISAVPHDEVDLAFITRLIENFQREGMGYLLWSAGDWIAGHGLYGMMNTWGNEIPLPPT